MRLHLIWENWRRGFAQPRQQWLLNQHIVVLACFVTNLAFSFVVPFLPLYVRQLGVEDLRQASPWSGIAFGATPLISATLAPGWGRLSDRYSRKLLMERSLLDFIVLLSVTGVVANVWQLLAARMAMGAFGGFLVLALALAVAEAPPETTGSAIGRVQTAQLVGHGIGPLFGGW